MHRFSRFPSFAGLAFAAVLGGCAMMPTAGTAPSRLDSVQKSATLRVCSPGET